jgi:hypothetical protein
MGLFDLFSNDTAENAAAKANAGITQGLSDLRTSYGQGRDALSSNYGKAGDLYAGLAGTYAPGVAAYSDASGAGGVEGLKRATDTFKNSGQYGVYGVGLTEGLQALDRTHAAAGNLSSGNADTDAMKYAADQASKAWGSYQTGLQPYLQNYGTAVAGQAGVDTGLGTALDASYRGEGGAANTADVGIGKNDAGAEMNNYQVGANQLNAILGAGKLAANAYSGGIGNLFNGFNFGGKAA